MLPLNRELLAESVTQSVEGLAFMPVTPLKKDFVPPNVCVRVRMSFITSSISARVELIAGQEFVVALAANACGVDPDERNAREKSLEAFKTLLDASCQHLLPRLSESPAERFDLTLPRAEILDDGHAWSDIIAQNNAVLLDCDSYPLAVRLITNN